MEEMSKIVCKNHCGMWVKVGRKLGPRVDGFKGLMYQILK